MFLHSPDQTNQYYQGHIHLLLDSYEKLLKQPLLNADAELSYAQQLFAAEFAVVSHNTDPDPLFNYANQTALQLFEMSWDEFVGMPSRYSAEPLNREERQRLLAEVTSNGYVDNYSGIRISKSGKRFIIEQAIVWNIYDNCGVYYGQAACFKHWRVL